MDSMRSDFWIHELTTTIDEIEIAATSPYIIKKRITSHLHIRLRTILIEVQPRPIPIPKSLPPLMVSGTEDGD